MERMFTKGVTVDGGGTIRASETEVSGSIVGTSTAAEQIYDQSIAAIVKDRLGCYAF